jgi:transketolase
MQRAGEQMFDEYPEGRAEDGEIFSSFDLASERSKATHLREEMRNVAISTTRTASTGLRLSTALGCTEVFLCGASARGRSPIISTDTFGVSAPLKELQKKFGFTCENIVATVKQQVAESM